MTLRSGSALSSTVTVTLPPSAAVYAAAPKLTVTWATIAAGVASLVSVSALFSSSVNDTRTLSWLSTSLTCTVQVDDLAPGISVYTPPEATRTHW